MSFVLYAGSIVNMFDIDELLDAAIKLHAEYHMGKEGLSDYDFKFTIKELIQAVITNSKPNQRKETK